MKLYLLSGLGADSRVFQYLNLPGVEKFSIEWIPPMKDETLQNYALRLCDQIKDQPANLLGVSFGGIIAQEIANHLQVRRLIIISSVKDPKEIGPAFQLVKFFRIWKLVGPERLKKGMLKMGHRFFGVKSGWEKDLLKKITLETDENFIGWAVQQIHTWKGRSLKDPIVHIHGTNDKLFPGGRIKNFIPVENGGHFMIVNRAEEISRLVLEALK